MAHLHQAVFWRYLRGTVLYRRHVAFTLSWKPGVKPDFSLETQYMLLFVILQDDADKEGRMVNRQNRCQWRVWVHEALH